MILFFQLLSTLSFAQEVIDVKKNNSTSLEYFVVPETFNYRNSFISDDDSWWNNWPRFSYYSTSISKVESTNASAMTVVHGLMDEGRGPFFRDHIIEHENVRPIVSAAKNREIRIMAWLEGMGDSRELLIALNEITPGNFEYDQLTETSKIIAHPWTWDTKGPGINPNANTTKWAGMASYVNKPSWLEPKGMSDQLNAPTYPNGDEAFGYINDDDSDPRNAFFYDALSGKDINGKVSALAFSNSVTNSSGKVPFVPPGIGGDTILVDDISLKKDMASGWWVERNILSAKFFMEHFDVDGFWIDNYTGWDFIGYYPIEIAFGEWSVSGFRDFLKEHEVEGEQFSEEYDIKISLKDRFLTYFPSGTPGDIKNSTTRQSWLSSVWIDDSLWKAFKSYKAEVANSNMIRLYQGIKDAALELEKEPDNILVAGNDLPSINFGSYYGNSVDIASTEYSPSYSRTTYSYCDGIPPYGHATPFYALTTSFTKSHIASVWYYLEGRYLGLRDKPVFGELLGYEALTGNVSLNLGEQQPAFPGNDASAYNTNITIEKMAPIFGQRKRDGDVGVYYSTSSEYLYLTPYGFAKNGRIPAVTGYYGWSIALERMHIQYIAVPEFKLTEDFIEDLSVLILPNVEAIDSITIYQVIVPFVERGGSVIISGETAGLYQGTKNCFSRNSSPLLYDLQLRDFDDGNVVFLENNSDVQFYIDHLSEGKDYGYEHLVAMELAINSLIDKGVLERQTEILGFNEGFIRAILHSDIDNERWFVDLLNTNIMLSQDEIIPTEEGSIILSLPSDLNRMPSFTFYDTDKVDPYKLDFVELSDGKVKLTIPGFRMYGSLIIDGQLGADIPDKESDKEIVLRISPNPVTDICKLSSSKKVKEIIIYSASGKILFHTYLGGINYAIIDVSRFNSGLYFLCVVTEDGRVSQHLVKL